jgi:hypothetical protein
VTGGDLDPALVGESHAEQPRRPAQNLLELGGLVEVEVPGEPEAVAQRPGSMPARVVAPTMVNGGRSSGIAVAPAPLPTTTSTR